VQSSAGCILQSGQVGRSDALKLHASGADQRTRPVVALAMGIVVLISKSMQGINHAMSRLRSAVYMANLKGWTDCAGGGPQEERPLTRTAGLGETGSRGRA